MTLKSREPIKSKRITELEWWEKPLKPRSYDKHEIGHRHRCVLCSFRTQSCSRIDWHVYSCSQCMEPMVLID